MDRDREISATNARLEDAAQMARFLAPIPNGGSLEALLKQRKVVSTRTYDDEEMLARFVRSDGTMVDCYTVKEVTIDEAEMIAAQCELMEVWNVEGFSRAVHMALDPEI